MDKPKSISQQLRALQESYNDTIEDIEHTLVRLGDDCTKTETNQAEINNIIRVMNRRMDRRFTDVMRRLDRLEGKS